MTLLESLRTGPWAVVTTARLKVDKPAMKVRETRAAVGLGMPNWVQTPREAASALIL